MYRVDDQDKHQGPIIVVVIVVVVYRFKHDALEIKSGGSRGTPETWIPPKLCDICHKRPQRSIRGQRWSSATYDCAPTLKWILDPQLINLS